MTAGEIVQRFKCSWPTMTRHLQTLEGAKLITVEKMGRERHYVLNHCHMKKVVGLWLKWFEEEDKVL